MSAELFIDTNILVYAHDLDAGRKHVLAKKLISQKWQDPIWPNISVQVLQELFVNLQKKGVDLKQVDRLISKYSYWRVADNTVLLVHQAAKEIERWQVSFWDGLLLSAARSLGATTVWSEDFNHKQNYDGVVVVNPFRE